MKVISDKRTIITVRRRTRIVKRAIVSQGQIK
jgi:hypothetical protein